MRSNVRRETKLDTSYNSKHAFYSLIIAKGQEFGMN